MDWDAVRHFDPEEFDDPEEPGSHKYIYPATVYLLDTIREKTGWAIITHNKYGLRGCVCVRPDGHSPTSLHYVEHGASAVDFHFDAPHADIRHQAAAVLRSGFPGIGIYTAWRWHGRRLPIGFHVDQRTRSQVWRRVDNHYVYLLP